MSKKFRKPENSSGQSLMEIVILIGVVVVVVGGLTVTVLNGLKNSQFSKNQSQATKLAQEGIERLRTIRERNWSVCIQGGSQPVVYWQDIWGSNYSFGRRANGPIPSTCNVASPNCSFRVRTTGRCSFRAAGDTDSQSFWVEPSTTPEILENGTFQRIIYIEDDPSDPINRKKVTSEVTWQDASGTHRSELVTILANF